MSDMGIFADYDFCETFPNALPGEMQEYFRRKSKYHSTILEDNMIDSTVLTAMALMAEDEASYDETIAELATDEIIVEPIELLSTEVPTPVRTNGAFMAKKPSNGLFVIKCKDCGAAKNYATKEDGGLVFPPTLVCSWDFCPGE